MWDQFLFRDKGLFLQHLHPVTALVYLGVLMTLALVYNHPLYLLGLLMVILLGIWTVDGFAGWEICFKISLGISSLIILVNLLVVRAGETIIWWGPTLPVLGKLSISVEAISYGAAMSVRLLNLISVFYLYNRMVHPDKVLRLFSRFASRSALVLSLSTRLFPSMIRQLQSIREVQIARGVDYQEGTLSERLQKYLSLLNSLLLTSLENSLDIAEAMQARAFGSGRPSCYRRDVFRPRDTLCLLGSLLALPVAAYGQIKGFSAFLYYPKLGYLINGLMTLVVLGIILGLLSFPMILSWGWQHCLYFKAKI